MIISWLLKKNPIIKEKILSILSQIPNFTNFAWLAQKSTARKTWYGLIPSFGAIFMLLTMSALIASGMWFWAALGAQTSASLISFFPILGKVALGVLFTTLVNFWFSHEIKTFMLNAKEVTDNSGFMNDKNPTDLRKMVDQLRQELNVYYSQKYGKEYNFPMPRICTTSDLNYQVITVEGRTPEKSALFISAGALNYKNTRMDQRHLDALIQMELAKIYARRSLARTITIMGTELITTIQHIIGEGWITRGLTMITELQFFDLFARSMSRSYEYEAAEIVVNCGHGPFLFDALDKTTCSTLDEKPTPVEAQQQRQRRAMPPYVGRMSPIINPVIDWLKTNRYATDNHDYMIFDMADIAVREGGFHYNELWNIKPRITRLKDHIKFLITSDPESGPLLSMANVTTEQLPVLYAHAKEKHRQIYDQIPDEAIPEGGWDPCISPDGDGQHPPLKPNAKMIQIQTLQGKVQELQEEMQEKQNQMLELRSEVKEFGCTLQTLLASYERSKTQILDVTCKGDINVSVEAHLKDRTDRINLIN